MTPAARSSATRPGLEVKARAGASGRAARPPRASRRRRSRRSAALGRLKRTSVGRTRRAIGIAGKIRGQVYAAPAAAPHRDPSCHVLHRHRAAERPQLPASSATRPILAAAIRQGIGLPYGCKDGACGSCKCRLLEGRVIHGAHQPKALSAEEEAAGYTLTCCARAADRRRARGAHGARRRRVPDPQDAVPGDRASSKPAPDVAHAARCSCRPTTRCATTPASTSSSSCATARGAATRWPTRRTRSGDKPGDRAAHPPPAGRQVHRPRVRRDEGKGHPAHRRPVRQLLPARGLRQADGAAGLGHRLRADQGDHRAHAASRASSARPCCTGAAAAGATSTCTTGRAGGGRGCRT